MPTDCDFVTDQNPALFAHLADKGLVPEYVMKSARVTSEETDPLSIVAFADPYNRRFPCHTKAACWQAAAYFAGNNMEEEHVKENIVKMAAAHDISEDVTAVFEAFHEELTKAAASQPKEEALMRKYAMTLDFEGFQGRGVEEFYPVNSYSEVITAAEDATTDFHSARLPMMAMRKVACNIVDAANEFHVPVSELTPEIRNMGIKRLPDPFAASELIGIRKDAGVDVAPYKAVLDELGEAITKTASADDAIELADDVAAQIVKMDTQNGIVYNNRMPNPYDLIFTGPALEELNKAAAQLVVIEGVRVPVADFLNLSDSTIEKTFSSKIGEVIKAAKADVAGDCTIEKCASANEKMLTLSTDARKVLLAVLSDTAW